MPIVRLSIVCKSPLTDPRALSQALAEAIAQSLGSRPSGTWVFLEEVPRSHYAENQDTELAAGLPVLVRLLLAKLPSHIEQSNLAQVLAKAIAATLMRPIENVHILFEPEAEGRIAFGGQL